MAVRELTKCDTSVDNQASLSLQARKVEQDVEVVNGKCCAKSEPKQPSLGKLQNNLTEPEHETMIREVQADKFIKTYFDMT